ncbi:lysophospholipid acyltransferase family protein [candidate division KSB1 bacterium]|nr:lysophospholipid acyltransferase family protein [candidate division KSB1 bacterium]
MQRDTRKRLLHYLAIKLAWLLLLGLGKTARIRVRHVNYWRQALAESCGLIYIVWHGKMLLPTFMHRRQNISAMVSEHGDGEIIAQTILRLGYRTVRGSSTRGGQRAFRDMLRQLKNGEHCTILPDGPTGPRQTLKMGAILLAQRSGANLLPITFAARKPIVLNSWDRFTLWWPFSKCTVLYGEPIKIPRALSPGDLEEQRLFVEQQLLALEKEADEVFRT